MLGHCSTRRSGHHLRHRQELCKEAVEQIVLLIWGSLCREWVIWMIRFPLGPSSIPHGHGPAHQPACSQAVQPVRIIDHTGFKGLRSDAATIVMSEDCVENRLFGIKRKSIGS